MSEVPELRALVRDVAERRTRRRRRRNALGLAVPFAAAASVIVLAVAPRDDSRRDERPAATSPTPTATAEANPFTPNRRDPNAPAATLAEAQAQATAHFGVLRRPARPSDRPDVSRRLPRARVPVEADWPSARRVAKLGGYEMFVMPGLWDGKPGFCLATQTPRGGGFGGCQSGYPTMAYPYWQATFERSGRVYFVLFPDGVESITLHLKSGRTTKLPITDNGALFKQRGLREISWHDPSGHEYRKRLAV